MRLIIGDFISVLLNIHYFKTIKLLNETKPAEDMNNYNKYMDYLGTDQEIRKKY